MACSMHPVREHDPWSHPVVDLLDGGAFIACFLVALCIYLSNFRGCRQPRQADRLRSQVMPFTSTGPPAVISGVPRNSMDAAGSGFAFFGIKDNHAKIRIPNLGLASEDK